MIKTVNLTTEVTAVNVTGKQNVIVKNIGNNTAYVSASPDISVGGDGVISVKAGELITLEGVATLKKVGNQYGVHGTVYALASGATTIELIPTNSVNFKPAAVDYSGDIADISSLIPTAANAGNQLTDKAYVDSELSEKVDKVDGMGLSSNDYTTAEKDKLAALTNYDDSTVNSAIADLQTGKADKSDTYTKTETDSKITEKVAEIVADAPEDFDTLKEMSDWIANHENDAAAMNSAIQTNTSNIASLQAGKVDKETGKSLVADSEIARLATLENYDDTAVKADISSLQSSKVDKETGKSLVSDNEIARLSAVDNYDDTVIKNAILAIQNSIASLGIIKITNLTAQGKYTYSGKPYITVSFDKVYGVQDYKIYVCTEADKTLLSLKKTVYYENGAITEQINNYNFSAGVTYKVKTCAVVNEIEQEISETTVTIPEA